MHDTEFAWSVPQDHAVFAGHFPGQPIVPGVMLLDRVILFAGSLMPIAPKGWQIGQVKFLNPVKPGERLCFHLAARDGGGIAFKVRADRREVASGTLTPLCQ